MPFHFHWLTCFHVTQHNRTREMFCEFMAEMATTAAVAIPTHFHELLVTLNYCRTLLRVYTQNIDGLELKAGLSTCSAYGVHDQDAICVPLHGHLHEMRCQSCGSTFSLDPFLGTLTAGELPICTVCQTNSKTRAHLQLRDRKTTSFLRPNIILYGEDHPLAEEIADLQKKDVSSVDLLLVVGTSMKVDGIQAIIRTFTKSLRRKQGLMRAIYLNTEHCSAQKWSEAFDFWVRGDCQLFAIMAMDELEKKEMADDGGQTLEVSLETSRKAEKSSQSGDTFQRRIAVTDRRLDLRPLWRYY
jgi:NAD-dependent histone deacetylase SIR2